LTEYNNKITISHTFILFKF